MPRRVACCKLHVARVHCRLQFACCMLHERHAVRTTVCSATRRHGNSPPTTPQCHRACVLASYTVCGLPNTVLRGVCVSVCVCVGGGGGGCKGICASFLPTQFVPYRVGRAVPSRGEHDLPECESAGKPLTVPYRASAVPAHRTGPVPYPLTVPGQCPPALCKSRLGHGEYYWVVRCESVGRTPHPQRACTRRAPRWTPARH